MTDRASLGITEGSQITTKITSIVQTRMIEWTRLDFTGSFLLRKTAMHIYWYGISWCIWSSFVQELYACSNIGLHMSNNRPFVWGNLQMFLNSRPKFLLVSFRLLQGLLLILKFSIVLDNAYHKEFMNHAATQNKPNLADAHNHVRIKIQEKALLDSFCCLRHRNSNSYRLDKLCA